MRETIVQAILAVETKYSFRFQPADQVKEKALQGAIQQYAKDVAQSDVLMLMDTTLFSSGKEGFLLTEEGLYSSYFKEAPGVMELKGLQRAEVSSVDNNKIICTYQNGTSQVRYVSIYAQYIADALTAFVAARDQQPAEGKKLSPLEQAIAQRLAAKKEAESKKPQTTPEPVKVAPSQIRQWARKGRELYQQGDYAEAFKSFRLAAYSGDVQAQYWMGVMFREGQGTFTDYAKAMEWFQKAAEQGSYYAENAIGNLYDKGKGVEQDYAEAFRWYEKAAQQGYARAQFNVGNMYYTGQGVEKDYEKTFYWYQKSAEQKDMKGEYGLGILYDFGRGVPQDKEKAVEWYRKAADQGHIRAQFNLGSMYENGEGVPMDLAQAAKWYQLAADQDHEKAKRALERVRSRLAEQPAPAPDQSAPAGAEPAPQSEQVQDEQTEAEQLVAAGIKEYQEGKYGDAFRTFQKAANLDHVMAYYNLGILYDLGKGVSRDREKAVRWYRQAAEQGLACAQFNLGQMYFLGDGVEQNPREAFLWYQKAADQGLPEAQAMLGAIYLEGNVIPRDRNQGLAWLRRAADQGLEAAQETLEKLA